MGLINPPNKKKRKWWPTEGQKSAEETPAKKVALENPDNEVEDLKTNGVDVVDAREDIKHVKIEVKSQEYSKVIENYKKYINALLEKANAVTLEDLKNFLEKWKINDDVVDEIASVTTYAHITKLLVYYNATQAPNDMAIFKILSFYEQIAHVDFRPIMPLVFGPSSAKHYENLVKLGSAIHICPKADEILNYFDPEYLWLSGIGITKFDTTKEKQEYILLYDPRFVGLSLFQAVQAGTDLNLKLFIEKNGLSFAFFLTSSPDSNLRAYGHSILADFSLKLKDLAEYGDFPEKPLILYVLNRIRTNTRGNARLLPVVANFFARSVKILLTPMSPLFPRIVSFFRQNFEIPFNQIPEFFRLMLSTSTEYGIQERCWILEIIKESMHTAEDFEILEKKHGTSLLLGMLASPFVTRLTIRWTLCIIKNLLYIPRALDVLVTRLNFHSWVAATIQFAKLTRWQIGFLTQIFIAYWRNVRRLHFKPNVNKPPQIELMIRETAKIISSYVEYEEDDIQNKWLRKIEWAKEPWKDYEDEVTDDEEREEVTEESYEKKKDDAGTEKTGGKKKKNKKAEVKEDSKIKNEKPQRKGKSVSQEKKAISETKQKNVASKKELMVTGKKNKAIKKSWVPNKKGKKF